MLEKNREKKIPSFGLSLLPLIVTFITLIVGMIILKVDIKILIIMSAIFTVCFCFFLGYSWADIQAEIVVKLAKALPSIMILITVGILIGAWMVSGTIPYLVYIGLKVINPKFIIITSFLVTVVLSVSTGTSWGSVGTVGAALMSVAAGMGAPLAAVAGAYFGDKMSPLSDSTNMTAIATGTNLYKHIGHMFYTTIPGFIISCIVYLIAGLSFETDATVVEVHEIIAVLQELYNMSMPVGIILLIPPVIIITGSLLKKPTVPIMIISSVVAIIIAVTIQGFSFLEATTSVVSGFKMDLLGFSIDPSAMPTAIPNLLQRGGMVSMMGSTLMAICGFTLIGALTLSGSLDVILTKVMKNIKGTGNLVLLTVILGAGIITLIGEATVTFLMVGGMLRQEYIKRGLETKNLSRTLEDSITIIEPLVPWSLAGVFMMSTLGVETLSYAPWAVLCYTGVIFAVLWGFTGFGMAKIKDGSSNFEEYVELTKEKSEE